MKFSDIPKAELESGNFLPETIEGLMATKRSEYSNYLKKSASKNVPTLIGTYLTICACFAAYALSIGQSISIFSDIYVVLLYLWIPFAIMLPITWYRRKPTLNELYEEICWYKEYLSTNSEIKA